jgi:hypothetical protein
LKILAQQREGKGSVYFCRNSLIPTTNATMAMADRRRMNEMSNMVRSKKAVSMQEERGCGPRVPRGTTD